MKQIAFWSRRGGAGRTMALANVAALLVQGKGAPRVVVRDLNHDGTLHKYFDVKKCEAPTKNRGVLYANPNDRFYASTYRADYELLDYGHSLRFHHEGCTPDILVPVLTPGQHTPKEVFECLHVRPGQTVLPFLSRFVEDVQESAEWRRSVRAAFGHFVEGEHFYNCCVPESTHWRYRNRVCADGVNVDVWQNTQMMRGYENLAAAIRNAPCGTCA